MLASEALSLSRYNFWANGVLCDYLASVPEEELEKPRTSLFQNILHTLNHILVINQIWRAHLCGQAHGFTARNTDTYPPLGPLALALKSEDQWWVNWTQSATPADLDEMLSFELIGGRPGTMTRSEMLVHVMSHASYHRGYVGDMIFQIPGGRAPQMDLTVFYGYERGQLPHP